MTTPTDVTFVANTTPAISAAWLNGINDFCFNAREVYTQYTVAAAPAAVAIPLDDTIPQITEGASYMSQVITPKSATNILVIDVLFSGSSAMASDTIIMALFQDATANALNVAWQATEAGVGAATQIRLRHTMVAGTTSATTFSVRLGSNSGQIITMNGATANRYFGGAMISSIRITEYLA